MMDAGVDMVEEEEMVHVTQPEVPTLESKVQWFWELSRTTRGHKTSLGKLTVERAITHINHMRTILFDHPKLLASMVDLLEVVISGRRQMNSTSATIHHLPSPVILGHQTQAEDGEQLNLDIRKQA